MITEDQLEQLALDWFRDQDYEYVCGYDNSPDGDNPERSEREATFEAIFASPEYVRVPMARPSSELRSFFASGVAMRAVISDRSL